MHAKSNVIQKARCDSGLPHLSHLVPFGNKHDAEGWVDETDAHTGLMHLLSAQSIASQCKAG